MLFSNYKLKQDIHGMLFSNYKLKQCMLIVIICILHIM